MTTKELRLPFEMTETDEDNVVFVKNISRSGKSPKQIRDIKANLPTTTIQYFSDEDFERLKAIEAKLLLELESSNPKKNTTFLSMLKRFLEI
ncbi:MAG TPA: hypothetical protein PK047_11080 [Saprospiraceae bacterium]|nr:hypothetical protein [Saprospiraceae bacterium]HRP42697.1 hypothetical protein [Saprospiraceae bacterium]